MQTALSVVMVKMFAVGDGLVIWNEINLAYLTNSHHATAWCQLPLWLVELNFVKVVLNKRKIIFTSLHFWVNQTNCRFGGGGEEGGLPYKNDRGAHLKFLKNSLKSTRILFDGCGSNEFFPLIGTDSKTTHHILSYFFGSLP